MANTPVDTARVETARLRIADSLAAIRGDFAELEELLRGPAPRSVAPVKGGRTRVSLYGERGSAVTPIPAAPESLGAAGILAAMTRYGLKERSFDVVVPVTAPNQIDSTGTFFDAKGVYDAWILNPSIDTKIDFDKAPSQNTPFISANSRMSFQVRKSKVYYMAQNAGTTGTMQIWLLTYQE